MISPDYQIPARMAAKARAVPWPDVRGKRVLDVGTDFGWWAFRAAMDGAADVLGLDRGRHVRGAGPVDLVERARAEADERGIPNCRFEPINLGRQWLEFGRFDLILTLSVYHHVYEQCGDHNAIWFWLRRHIADDGELLWEGPMDDRDPVIRMNVSDANRPDYTREAILAAAGRYFEAELIGPALHEPHREVWRFRPRGLRETETAALVESGAGGASKAFLYAAGRRIAEVEGAFGFRPWPGSLNLVTEAEPDLDAGYYRVRILDVADRGKGLDSEWKPRWLRLYPLTVDGHAAHAFRFEGERYDRRRLELIAPFRLRDVVGERVTLRRAA